MNHSVPIIMIVIIIISFSCIRIKKEEEKSALKKIEIDEALIDTIPLKDLLKSVECIKLESKASSMFRKIDKLIVKAAL